MDAKQTLKYALRHLVLSTLAAIVGLGIVAGGVVLGFGDSITIVVNEAPQNWGDAVAAAQPVTFGVMAGIGILVWQFGKAWAQVSTASVAARVEAGGDAAGAEGDVKSEVMAAVDDRVSSLESAVERNHQKLQRSSSSGNAAAGGDRRSASDGRRSASASESAGGGASRESSSIVDDSTAGSSRESSRRAGTAGRSGSGDASSSSDPLGGGETVEGDAGDDDDGGGSSDADRSNASARSATEADEDADSETGDSNRESNRRSARTRRGDDTDDS